jgi:hypothetical protein
LVPVPDEKLDDEFNNECQNKKEILKWQIIIIAQAGEEFSPAV